MEVCEFFERLTEKCTKVPQIENRSRCEQCDMRLFCYTAPLSMTQDIVRQAVNYLQDYKFTDTRAA